MKSLLTVVQLHRISLMVQHCYGNRTKRKLLFLSELLHGDRFLKLLQYRNLAVSTKFATHLLFVIYISELAHVLSKYRVQLIFLPMT